MPSHAQGHVNNVLHVKHNIYIDNKSRSKHQQEVSKPGHTGSSRSLPKHDQFLFLPNMRNSSGLRLSRLFGSGAGGAIGGVDPASRNGGGVPFATLGTLGCS